MKKSLKKILAFTMASCLRQLCIHVPVRGGLGQRPDRFGRTNQNIDVLRR